MLAEKFGLSSRVKLEQMGEKHIGILKLVKSRIIQKDAMKIIELSNQIRNVNPTLKVSLVCYDNICSKSLNLIQLADIDVVFR